MVAIKGISEVRRGWTAAQWNERYPVGTPVLYWPGVRSGEGVRSCTQSGAWELNGAYAVVQVQGKSGCIALTHVAPIPQEEAAR